MFCRSRHELSNLKLVWETVQAIQKQQNEWKQESWQKMETKQLREITTEQLRTVHALPEETHYWDVYMGLQESIMVIQVSKAGLRLGISGLGLRIK